jgi:hypothetical protein
VVTSIAPLMNFCSESSAPKSQEPLALMKICGGAATADSQLELIADPTANTESIAGREGCSDLAGAAAQRRHPQRRFKTARCYPNDREGPSPQSVASLITGFVISEALACDWLWSEWSAVRQARKASKMIFTDAEAAPVRAV